jgi:hypothetical protein
MERKINVGDRVICSTTGVIGTVISFYTIETYAEQVNVKRDDGHYYHAPISFWSKLDERKKENGKRV